MMVMTAVCVVAVSACGVDAPQENSGEAASTSASDVVSTTIVDSTPTPQTQSTEAATTTISTATTTTTAHEITTTTVTTAAVDRTQSTACSHSATKVVNAVAATCIREGYTGDTYCSRCDALIKRGESQPKTQHKNTEIRGKKEPTESS